MNLSVSGFFKQLSAFYKKLSKGTKIFIFAFIGLVAVIAIIVSISANSGKYAVLYRGLSSSEGAQVLSYLEDNAVDVKVENDGSILVPAGKVAALKMQLAAEGYPNDALNYDMFTSQSDLLTTDYEKKKLLIFQLQDRLQQSILTLQGVKNAIVTLSIPDDNTYVLKDEQIDITASVVLSLYSGVELTAKQIGGIEKLVANSVPGLAASNVAIIDSNGEQLNGESDSGAVSGAGVKLETINLINTVYANKIEEFLKPVFGKNGMSVVVNVAIDFRNVSTEETIYTPVIGENGIISWVERTKSTSGSTGGGNGSDVPTYEESTDVSGSDSGGDGSFTAEYLVNQLIRKIQDDGGNITDMTVAVIINKNEMSEEDKQSYRELIAYSAGIATEKVAIANAEFITVSVPEIVSQPEGADETLFGLRLDLGRNEIIVLSGGALLLIIIITVITISIRAYNRKKMRDAVLTGAAETAGQTSEKKKKAAVPKIDEEDMPREIVLNETREQALKRQIKDFSSGNAETVAQLLRSWIKDGED